MTEEEAEANATSQKWVDKQRANTALLAKIIGTDSSVRDTNYDACMRVRSVLARLPANRLNLYPNLPIKDRQ